MRRKSAKIDPQPQKKKPGCVRRLSVGVIGLSLIGIICIAIASIMGGNDETPTLQSGADETPTLQASADETPTLQASDDETYTLQGEVLIMNDANFEVTGETCRGIGTFDGIEGGATMRVTVRDHDSIETTLDTGTLSPEGNCQLLFVAEIPDGEWAMFATGSQSEEQRLNTGGADQFREGASVDDWWVSMQYD